MRCIRLTLLLVLVAAANADAEAPAPPAPEAPASQPPAVLPDEVIVITGLRLPRPVHDVPAAVTVIDREQVQRSPHPLADELIREAPGVGTFRRSSSEIADPTSQGLNLRGVGPSGVSRALVLRDGIPVNDPFGGWVYWRAISPLGIDRIEIVPSGASALFGNFALGGVLQVISRPIDGRSLDAVLSAGSLGTQRLAARATQALGDFAAELSAERLHTGGYPPIVAAQRGAVDGPASSTHDTAGARLEYRHGDSTAHAGIRAFTESLDAGTQHTTADVRTVTYEAGWQRARTPGMPGTLELQVFGGQQRFDQERARVAADRATAASASTQRTPSSNQGAAVTWSGHPSEPHAVVLGVDAQRVSGTATDRLTPATIADDTLVKRAAGGQQRFLGVFAQDAVQLSPALELAAALRLDGWQNLAARSTLTRGDGSAMTTRFADSSTLELDPRLGALVHITHDLAVRASAYRGFRAPTLNELYRPFQVGTVLTAANERLRPETLWGGELGTQIAVEGVRMQATAFWNQLRDAIANVTLAEPLGGATRQRQNLGVTRIFGLELDLAWRPTEAWTVRVAHTFSDGHVAEAPAQPELVGKRLAQAPRDRTTAQLTYDHEPIATISAQLRYLGRQFEDDLNTLPIGAVVLVDARAERRLAWGVSLFVSGQNLFDRHYLVGRAGIDTEGAPRTFELGVAYHASPAPRPR
ncbi:MAG TPA: TonB-dependent receptor [Kofleriaceae bacterium]|jgi:outer membrane receptor protein involved in Fe transport|nr:TonB-dependent receptor [Kofleriaceae bacterium]